MRGKRSISVIIPVYNEEKYIGECIDSIINQTIKPEEIIVVDDGSTDKTAKVLSEFQTSNFKPQIFTQRHCGPGIARNSGVKKASGDILVFVDADIKYDRKYIENLIKPIAEEKAVATFTKEEYVANPQNVWAKCWSINSFFPLNLHIDPAMPDEATNFRAIKRDVFLQTKGYRNIGYGEDVTVIEQLKGIRAKLAKGAICYHYNPSTLAEVFTSARWMGRGNIIEKNIRSMLIYSLLNALRRGVLEATRHRIVQFVLFKIVFDFGVSIGIIERFLGKNHAK